MLVVTELKRMRQRYDTAANFTSGNPTLLAGEIGIESDTKNMKVGDGSTAWTSLAYASVGVTARDTSLGRLAIGGHEVGDTGWRDVSADLLNGWTTGSGGSLELRRIGNRVELRLGYRLDASSKTSNHFYTLPSNFRWSAAGQNFQQLGVIGSGSGATATTHFVYTDANVNSSALLTSATGTIVTGTVSWFTDQAWPISLPGTAA